MPKKDDVPDHVAKYQKLSKKAKQMVRTMERHHRQAYDAAVDDVLIKDGQVDLDLLDKPENQDKFAEKMANHYVSKAKQTFKISDAEFGKLDDLEKELLMNAYAGTTKAQLTQYIRTKGKEFTFEHFYNEVRPGLMEQIEKNLKAAASTHFTDKHIGDIIQYTKTGHFVDPKRMRLGDALGLLYEHEELGTVLEKKHRKALYYKGEQKAA